MTFTLAHLYGNVYMWVGVDGTPADSSNFGLLGSKVHQNGTFPALDAALALSLAVWITNFKKAMETNRK